MTMTANSEFKPQQAQQHLDLDLLNQYRQMLGAEGTADTVNLLLQVLPSYFHTLQELAATESEAAFRQQAHKAKSACRSGGLKVCGDMLAALEKKAWTKAELPGLLQALEQEYELASAHLQRWLQVG